MEIIEYLNAYNISLNELSQNYLEDFQRIFNQEKKESWFVNIEDKLKRLKNEYERNAINNIIQKLKNNSEFNRNDTEDLKIFIKKINSITKVADRINNFKENTDLGNGKKLMLYELFNKVASSNSLSEFNSYNLNERLDSFKVHLFSVIKNCQAPEEYPIYYKLWKNITREVLVRADDYDSLCLFYREFPKDNRSLLFGTYFGTLATLIASNFSKSELRDKEKNKKYIINNVINLEKYSNMLDDNEVNTYISNNTYKNMNPLRPLNQILFGAPGTGKTYNTKRIAVEIINGEKERTREEINKEYEELATAKQIVFTTFHQSLSYEDFIEGIKPETTDGNVTYEVKDGIFKQLCSTAIQNGLHIGDLVGDYKINKIGSEIIYLEKPRAGTIVPIPRYLLSELSQLVLNGKIDYESIKNKSAIDKMSSTTEKYIVNGYPNILAMLVEKIIQPNKIHKQNYVLIIDEINRGNVSAIFGELITLLEEDKRKGNKEQIEAVLPYSNERFSVPNNVYIIGTMNTADRSVEALDTALRRRFSFVEMQPNPDILSDEVNVPYKDVNLMKLLKTINQRIEVLIDKDRQIGHSYFIGIQNLECLKQTFKDKIIPLLEEYFYGDFGKIGLVLGGSFIYQETNKANFPKNFTYENDFLEDKKVYRFTSFNEWSEQTFISVYEDSINE